MSWDKVNPVYMFKVGVRTVLFHGRIGTDQVRVLTHALYYIMTELGLVRCVC